MKKWPNFPDFGISVATNGFGYCLILLKSNADESLLNEEIFMWIHETGEVTKIANTIKELISDLKK